MKLLQHDLGLARAKQKPTYCHLLACQSPSGLTKTTKLTTDNKAEESQEDSRQVIDLALNRVSGQHLESSLSLFLLREQINLYLSELW